MGMTYDQFWDGSPSLVIAYRDAYKLQRERENEMAWLQGLYIHDAFSAALANAFSKRGAKKRTYIEKPIDIFPLTEREKKRREAEQNEKMQKAMEAIARKQRRAKPKRGG